LFDRPKSTAGCSAYGGGGGGGGVGGEEEGEAVVSQIYFGMKLYMFQTVPLPIIRSYSLYTQQWYTSYRCVDSHLQTCMTYTDAVCTVKNSR
jgi:hypothetical protein